MTTEELLYLTIIAIIPIIAAFTTVLFADRPIFAKIQNPAKTAKNAVLLALISALLLGNLEIYSEFLSLLFRNIPIFEQGATILFYYVLAIYAPGASLGLAITILARRRKPKRQILQNLAIVYSAIIGLTSLLFAIWGFYGLQIRIF